MVSNSVAAALLAEFNEVIGPQKRALAERLPQLFTSLYQPPAELPSQTHAGVQGAAANGGAAAPGVVKAKRTGDLDAGAAPAKRLKTAPSEKESIEKKEEELRKEVGLA
jgi:hypothetical protein